MSVEIERSRKEYKLLNEYVNYINTISKENNLKPSYALPKIISEHKDISKLLGSI